MRYVGFSLLGLFALGVSLTLGYLLLRPLTSEAIQAPRMSLDMDPSGNTYDPATNTMTLGPIDACLASPEANAGTHTHTAHLVIQNVEELVAWDARLNYDGSRMRPVEVDFSPFVDSTTGQDISFLNLPKGGVTDVHRGIIGATSDLSHPNSLFIVSTFFGERTLATSPDTPAKAPPDDSSYSAPNGGVLAAITFEVSGDQSGRTLFMQLDDGNPNRPGSAVVVFSESGSETNINLPESDLSSGFHAEGADSCSSIPTPTNGPHVPVANIRMVNVDIDAPTSVQTMQSFQIKVAFAFENEGPDETDVRYQVWFAFPQDCLGPPDTLFGEVSKMAPRSVVTRENLAMFACGGAQLTTIRLAVAAYGSAADLDTYNNGWSDQVVINVIGASPLPTPTPVPSTEVPVAGSLPASSGPGGGTVSTSGVLAAALPSTGGSGDDGFPAWAYLLLLAGALALPSSAALAVSRLLSLRRR